MSSTNSNEQTKSRRCCRVIVNCFLDGRSPRNNSPVTRAQCLELLKKVVDVEETNIKENNYDIIIINHDTGFQEGNRYLDSINNKNIGNGIIRVVHTENKRVSFDGYNTAFQMFKKEYDYWIFSEDDHILFADSYYKRLIDDFESLETQNIGFLALAPISKVYTNRHSGGGFGLTKTEFLETISKNQNGSLSCLANKGCIRIAEICFTNDFIKNGFNLIENNIFYLSPKNLDKCEDHKINFTAQENREFLFQVGL
jgi:hypothetical protein